MGWELELSHPQQKVRTLERLSIWLKGELERIYSYIGADKEWDLYKLRTERKIIVTLRISKHEPTFEHVYNLIYIAYMLCEPQTKKSSNIGTEQE